MNAPAPEADNQYSKSSVASRRAAPRRIRPSTGGSWLVAIGGLIAAGLLLAAEFRPLYVVHVTTYRAGTTSVSTGAHDSYALVPIALLAAALALAAAPRVLRAPAPAACAALAALGVIVLLIALVGDLPDTRARGITHGLTFASTTAGAGLYLETLGAVLLLGAGGAGLVSGLFARRPPRRRSRRPGSGAPGPRTRIRRPSGESAS